MTQILMDPQPKHGKPFQVQGDATGRFYNENPRYPDRGPMFSYAWAPPTYLVRSSVMVEKIDGLYYWVGEEKDAA